MNGLQNNVTFIIRFKLKRLDSIDFPLKEKRYEEVNGSFLQHNNIFEYGKKNNVTYTISSASFVNFDGYMM